MESLTTTGPLTVTDSDLALPEGASPDKDAIAHWYAWGRMDAGDKPVVIYPVHSRHPSTVATAWHFGRMWAAAEANLHKRGYAPGIPTAWDNYVESGGRTVYLERI